MPFRLVPKSTTLDDLELSICIIAETMRLSEIKLNDDPYCQQRKCIPMTLLPGDIRFMRTFTGVPWKGGVKRQCGC